MAYLHLTPFPEIPSEKMLEKLETGKSTICGFLEPVEIPKPPADIPTDTHHGSECQEDKEWMKYTGSTDFDLPPVESDFMTLEGDDEVLPKITDVTDLYKNYSWDHVYNDKLPITRHRENILRIIDSSCVSLVQGSTGSGKSTQVPQYILDQCRERSQICRVLVTQPRRIAALSIAKRISQERGWPLGTMVGYQIARERLVTSDTCIIYVTLGLLLQKLITGMKLEHYTHIVLDEVHERDQDTDFCLMVIKQLIKTTLCSTKIILMSATMDVSLFQNYFAIDIGGQIYHIPTISIEGKIFEVDEYYLDNFPVPGVEILSSNVLGSATQEYLFSTFPVISKLLVHFDKHEQQEGVTQKGTVLVFLPGMQEIESMDKHLRGLSESSGWQVLPLHSTITGEDQIKIFLSVPSGKRRIILATNIAESSITVPDVRYIVDSCMVKQLEYQKSTNFSCLVLCWTSKASAQQRKGRAGRVTNGLCFRMLTRMQFDQLEDYCLPEMKRVPIETVVLRAKHLNLGPPQLVLQSAIEPPKLDTINSTILMLKEIGALTLEINGAVSRYDGDLTYLGWVVSQLPLDVRVGKMLILGYVLGLAEECLVMAASLSLKSFFVRPYRKELDSYRLKMFASASSQSDPITCLLVYKEWKHLCETNTFDAREKEFASSRHINLRSLKDVDKLVGDLSLRLRDINIHVNMKSFYRREYNSSVETLLKMVICAAFYPFYFLSNPLAAEQCIKELSGHNPLTTVVISHLPKPSPIYRNSLGSILSECGPLKALHFQGTKVHVEFSGDTSKGKPIPAVYLALKLRTCDEKMVLYSCKEPSEDLLKAIKELSISSDGSPILAEKVSVFLGSSSGFSNLAGMPSLVKKPHPGNIETFCITEVVTPSRFWVVYASPSNIEFHQDLVSKLNEEIHSLRALGTPKGGDFCLAPYKGLYYRARIIEIKTTSVEVFFLDYGNMLDVPEGDLKEMPQRYLQVPCQAMLCRLHGVQPVKGDSWDPEPCCQFRDLVNDQSVSCKVQSESDGVLVLEVFLRSADEMVCVNKWLVSRGLASLSKESVTMPFKRSHSNSEKCDWIDLDPTIISSQLTGNYGGRPALKYNLHGPSSPHQLNFHWMVQAWPGCSGRSVNVARDSVNSVVLCGDLGQDIPRLLVACFVSISQETQNIITRNTTLMQNQVGLSSLLPLLFAPYAEMRYDKDFTRYTGALCGLGFDPSSGRPLMPENDLEVAFDMDFSQADLTLINAIRETINIALTGEKRVIIWSRDKVDEIRRSLSEKLLILLQMQRQRLEPCYFHAQYKWNQVPQQRLLKLKSQSLHTFYRLHNSIHFQYRSSAVHGDSRTEAGQPLKIQLKNLSAYSGKEASPLKTPVPCPVCRDVLKTSRDVLEHLSSTKHRVNVAKAVL